MTLIGLAAAIAVDCDPCAQAYLARCREIGISDAEIADVLAKVMAVSAGMKKIKFSRVVDSVRTRSKRGAAERKRRTSA